MENLFIHYTLNTIRNNYLDRNEYSPNSSSLVSHTTDDMVFQWDPDVPLVVDDNIELPQLALVKNHTADCK